jgi:hypothetical protein
MDRIIECISYPFAFRLDTANGPVFGKAMKSYVVGLPAQFANGEMSIVSSIAPAEGGGYAVAFEDGRLLFVNDCIEMEVLYKPLQEDGTEQDKPLTEGV